MAAQIPLATLFDLSGKTALVTGAAMGIGFGAASRLAEAGADVVIADLDEAAAEAAAKELVGYGWKAVGLHCDVADKASVAAAVDFVARTFDGIDILVNNAGIYPMTPLLDMPDAVFDKTLDVNLRGVYFTTKAVAAKMIERGRGGRIVNVTSIDALHPSMVGLAAYDASKHGVWGFTKNVALELAPHGIWVNAVAPGGIETPGSGAESLDPEIRGAFEAMIPMGRMGLPDDIGRAVLFLASDLASYLTGTQIVADGGRLLR